MIAAAREEATATGRADAWPKEPYKGLAFYGAEDRLLFSGRDRDVDSCIHRLASAETRILLLHGNTGCGKSSFLRAGLIPGLEERGFGYFFLRDAAGSPLFIRCGSDPLGRIAEHVFRFASASVPVEGVAGVKTLDLSAARLGHRELSAYVEACRKPYVLMDSLHEISAKLPFTLVIILDQAEEVITLGDATPECRRQFFQFVKEFSSINFPIKFVVALRKDHSGRFIELAQEGGSLDLRAGVSNAGVSNAGPSNAAASAALQEQTRRAVKADIKIFLLSEFSSEEVLHAIKLPTSRDPIDNLGTPFAQYGFEYAPGVAEKIVKDLFDTPFTAAVLPVMQIVCRDLYKTVRPPPEQESAKPPPWIIAMSQYEEGGQISGPVDRHISTSLRASFGALPKDAVEEEERRWREILFRLVRRESDGTVHTRIVSLKELRTIAAEQKAKAKLDDVIAYLTQPEILLLRAVTVVSGAGDDETGKLSLGHDFIAMVLQRWKTGEQEAQHARERIAKITRNAFITGAAVVGAIAVIVFFTLVAMNAGKTIQTHEVLLNTVKASQRDAPQLAMLASAHAMNLAEDMKRYLFWRKRDRNADLLLAQLLAGLPEMKFPAADSTTMTPQADFTNRTFALPKSVRFVDVDGNDVRMTTGGDKRFKLRAFDDLAPGGFAYRPRTIVSENKAGVVLLLRTSSSPFQELGPSTHQAYVILPAKDKVLGPFGADYFLRKLDPSASNGGRPTHSRGVRQLGLSGGAVVLSTSTLSADPGNATFRVDTFAFADERPADDPFVHNLKLESTIDARKAGRGGLPQPLFFDDFLVVPEAASGANDDSAAPMQRLVKYNLATSSPIRQDLIPAKDQKSCPGGCEWQWIPGADSANRLLVFGAPKAGNRVAQRAFDQASTSSYLDSFAALWIIDVVSGQAITVDTAKVSTSLAACAVGTPTPGQDAQPEPAPTSDSLLPKRSSGKIFVAGSIDTLYIGLVTGHSIDLMGIAKGASNCVGTLYVQGELGQWMVSQDGKTLLGVGETTGASWSIAETVSAKAGKLRGEGKLHERACAAGLKDVTKNLKQAEWTSATHLLTPPAGLCETPSHVQVQPKPATAAIPDKS